MASAGSPVRRVPRRHWGSVCFSLLFNVGKRSPSLPAMPTFTIQIPLSAFGPNAKTGHVSLIKREASAPSASERPNRTDGDLSVLACAAYAKGGASYDLAVGKKS